MQNTQKRILPQLTLIGTVALASATPSAFALVNFARGTLNLEGGLSVTHDTNIEGFNNGGDDTYYTLAPGINFSRQAGQASADASVSVGIKRYQDFTQYDSEDLSANASLKLPQAEGLNTGTFSIGYNDTSAIDQTLTTIAGSRRLRTKAFSTSATGFFPVSRSVEISTNANYIDSKQSVSSSSADQGERTTLEAGIKSAWAGLVGSSGLELGYNFGTNESRTFDLASTPFINEATSLDQITHHINSGIFYKFASGLRATANLGYRWLNRTEAADNADVTYGISFEGPFLSPHRFPNLKSNFRIGYEKSQAPGIGDNGNNATIVGALRLSWDATPFTSLDFSADRSQGLTTDNFSAVTSAVSAGVKHKLGKDTSCGARIGRNWITYPTSNQDTQEFTLSGSVTHTYDKNWSFGLSYTFLDRSADIVASEYDRHVISLSTNARF